MVVYLWLGHISNAMLGPTDGIPSAAPTLNFLTGERRLEGLLGGEGGTVIALASSVQISMNRHVLVSNSHL